MSALEIYNVQKELVDEFNLILKNTGVNCSITLSDITFTEKIVTDFVKPDQKLSNSIIEFIWPSINSKVVYHYTSKNGAESILNSDSFRLYSILKRFSEGEIVAFCKNHNLQGYLDEDESGEPVYKSLIMDDMYYASFTETELTKEEEEYFWRVFAPIDGVRLKLKITASNPNFRKMVYEKTKGKPISVLKELTNKARNKFSKEFIFAGISRMCAFYLSKDYAVEKEYRALYRSWEGFGPKVEHDGKYKYIAIPLNKMSDTGYTVEVLEIQTNEALSIPERYSVVARNT